MQELDNNVFINKWHCTVDDYYLHKTYYIYYIDGSHRRAVFTSFSTEEEIAPQLLHLIDKDLREKGWVKKTNGMRDKIYKVQYRTDKFHLGCDGYKEMIEKQLAEKIIRDIPHEDLVKLFNIEWFQVSDMDEPVEARASIRYELPATIEGEPPVVKSNYTEDDYV